MSSILKALRKLEEERARQRETAPEIATSILRVAARRKLLPLWLWPGVVVGGMLLAAALFWGLRPEPATPVAPVVPTATAPAVQRSSSADAIIEEVLDTRVPAVPVAAARRTPPAPVVQSSQSRRLPPSASPSTVTTPPTVVTAPVVPVTSDPTTVPPLKSTQPLAGAHSQPVVSAIAWQEDRASRMAVVNGLPVMEGELVGTAMIEEIQADGVVFSENGQHFSVPMQ